jgi:hypothetical protein
LAGPTLILAYVQVGQRRQHRDGQQISHSTMVQK